LKSFVEKNDVPWTIVTQQKMEGVKFDDQYGISAIPTMFLVGADGKVITINARGKLMELLGKIYPDVKVPEEKEIPEEIELDDSDSDSQTGIEKKNSDSVTESESMAGTEDEDEEDADASEEAKPEEISTDFVPPEDATPEALRDAVYVQFMQLVQSAKGNPFEPVLKFQKSVNAQGNADLTQFLDWNVETLRFLTVKIRTATDIQALAEELAELLTKGEKIKALRPEFLQPLTQLSVQLISALDPPAAKKLAAAVQNALASSGQPWAPRAAKMIQGILTQMDLPGKPLELVAKTLDGKEIKIQDFAGKTVLVDVWATWCGPCRAEFPRMAKAYEAFHDAGFEIIGLSVDKDVEKLKDFVEEEKTPWVIATQEGMDLPESFSEKYGIMGIPTMFLIGADGKVLTTNARGRLMQLLGEIYPEAARKKAEEETRLDAPTDAAAPSQSMSTTEEAAEEDAQEQAKKPASEANILEQFSTLPKDSSLAATKEFLESFDQHAYEIQAALQQSPSMEAAMGKFQKIQDVRAQAADLIIANEQATEADLKLAADIKIQAILFTAQVQNDPKGAEKADAAFSKLIAALEARKAEALVIQVQVEQIIAGSMLLGRMPNAEEMGATLEKLTAVCQRAKASKCMNGDLMGQFMRMIVSANDLGVEVGKIETACTALREAVLATEDPQLINTAGFITGMARRAMLKGKPMELVGTTLDGQTVDIQKDYAGKVVLVDFWATWCNPCVMELKNLEDKYYAAYHEKGFEILGFSIDADRNQLAAFLERRKLPWQTICQQGDFDPVFYYGIQAIPCLILVGQDGKVIREIPTMRRDEVLSAELKKIYGE
ncbi:MAG: TlpA family protein disulfide reductase, partial [Thermoguttaceae bacterium]|nr:TlpA family protein disulfide reductase [Thermoguttaceae bacterium]